DACRRLLETAIANREAQRTELEHRREQLGKMEQLLATLETLVVQALGPALATAVLAENDAGVAKAETTLSKETAAMAIGRGEEEVELELPPPRIPVDAATPSTAVPPSPPLSPSSSTGSSLSPAEPLSPLSLTSPSSHLPSPSGSPEPPALDPAQQTLVDHLKRERLDVRAFRERLEAAEREEWRQGQVIEYLRRQVRVLAKQQERERKAAAARVPPVGGGTVRGEEVVLENSRTDGGVYSMNGAKRVYGTHPKPPTRTSAAPTTRRFGELRRPSLDATTTSPTDTSSPTRSFASFPSASPAASTQPRRFAYPPSTMPVVLPASVASTVRGAGGAQAIQRFGGQVPPNVELVDARALLV
ncbi:hypothetical protein HDU96_000381, partial [Phlyctochytrium bullatum]